MSLRWPRKAPRWLQDGPRWSQDGPKRAPRWPQDGPKMAPRRPQDGFLGPAWGSLGPIGAILGRGAPRSKKHMFFFDQSPPGTRGVRAWCVRGKQYKSVGERSAPPPPPPPTPAEPPRQPPQQSRVSASALFCFAFLNSHAGSADFKSNDGAHHDSRRRRRVHACKP